MPSPSSSQRFLKLAVSRFHRGVYGRCRRAFGTWTSTLWPRRRRLVVMVAIPAGLIGSACAIYLCCRSSGQLSTVSWLPDAIAQWADRHGQFRNLPAFLLLAFPILVIFREMRSRIWAGVVVGVFGTVLELAEYFLPNRSVEWQDIVWTWAGVIIAWFIIEVMGRLLERLGLDIFCPDPS